MRDAVMLLDQVRTVGVSTAEGFQELFGLRDVSVALLTSAAERRAQDGYAIIDEQFYRTGDAAGMVADLTALVRDLLVVKAGGEIVGRSAEAVDARVALAARFEMGQLVSMVRTLWELRDRTRASMDDQRTSMDLAYALICDAADRRLRQASTGTASAPIPQESQRLSLDAMKSMSAAAGLTVRS